jgi:hypothetical protein
MLPPVKTPLPVSNMVVSNSISVMLMSKDNNDKTMGTIFMGPTPLA